MKLLILVVLSFLAYTTCMKYVDYRTTLSATLKACTKPGFFCDTCTHRVACAANDDGTFTKAPVENCPPSNFCEDGTCTSADADSACWGVANWDFFCPAVGIFPDQVYCDKFNLCINKGSSYIPYLYDCEPGYGFNIATDLCNIELVDGQCGEEYPVPICENPGQSGPLPEKPEMYYWCEAFTYNETTELLYPALGVCPRGEQYSSDSLCTKVG